MCWDHRSKARRFEPWFSAVVTRSIMTGRRGCHRCRGRAGVQLIKKLNQLVELEWDVGVSAAGSRDLLQMTTQKNALLHQCSSHLILLCCVHDVLSRFCDGMRRTEDSNAEDRCEQLVYSPMQQKSNCDDNSAENATSRATRASLWGNPKRSAVRCGPNALITDQDPALAQE